MESKAYIEDLVAPRKAAPRKADEVRWKTPDVAIKHRTFVLQPQRNRFYATHLLAMRAFDLNVAWNTGLRKVTKKQIPPGSRVILQYNGGRGATEFITSE